MTPRARKRQRIDRALAAHAQPPGVVLTPSGEDRTDLAVAWLARLIARRRAGTLTDR